MVENFSYQFQYQLLGRPKNTNYFTNYFTNYLQPIIVPIISQYLYISAANKKKKHDHISKFWEHNIFAFSSDAFVLFLSADVHRPAAENSRSTLAFVAGAVRTRNAYADKCG